MKHNIFTFIICTGIGLSTVLTSCVKNDNVELGDKGQSILKIVEAPSTKFFFSPFTNQKKVDLFSLRRDANSTSTLQSSQTFKVDVVSKMVDNYNAENHTAFEILPDGYYTVANSAYQKSGTSYNVAFNSGDFAKEFTITLDGSKWLDLGKKYALGFRITDAAGALKGDGQDSVVVMLSIKNKYDGKYEAVAIDPMVDAVNAALSGSYPFNYELHTVSANAVVLYHPLNDNYSHSILNAGAASSYGSFAPVFTMDDAGTVTSVTNYYGQPAANGRSAVLDPSGVNKFTINANGSKTLEVKYFLLQPGANIRTTFSEKFTYKGER